MKTRVLLCGVLVALAGCTSGTGAPEPETSVAPTTTAAPPVVTVQQDPSPSPTATDSFRVEIAVIGDFGSGNDREYDVARAMQEAAAGRDVDLFLTTGDNFYSDDVDEIWTLPYGWLEEQGIAVAAAWGNHDVETESRKALVQEALQPPGRWYSLPIGDGTLLVLDSNQVGNPEQLEWMRAELEEATPPVVVSFHHPAYSCGVYADYDDVRDNWVPIFEDFEIALVLNGHEHHYERFVAGGRTYVVTGGGGQRIRDRHECAPETPEPVASNYEESHFVLLTIDRGSILGEAINVEGETIDVFSVDY